ncbi:hypothetical protein [Antarctobacter jejuensis]|uniref:hypothetical protein n=1 Tax=Antarctobacter jejuensis TaxID=1439938 RepID=UPI003FD68034
MRLKLNAARLWSQVIEASHSELFDFEYLRRQGQKFGEISDGTYSGGGDGWETIDKAVCRFEQASELPGKCWGFDLPLLFTPENWNQRVVALVFQDPKRVPEKDELGFSIATPWGFSSPRIRSHGIARKIWPSVEGLCSIGYGVYLTDAWKLFFAKGSGPKSKSTQMAERCAITDEMDTLNPELVCTFGRAAERGLNRATYTGKRLYLPHPNARGNTLRDFYGTCTGKYDVIGEATLNRIKQDLPR